MRHDNRFMRLVGWCLCSAVLLGAMAASVLAQEGAKMKKFLKKPLVIEDQGSFFIGGVPKVTPYATVPPPKLPTRRRMFPTRSPSARCMCPSRYRRTRKGTCRR